MDGAADSPQNPPAAENPPVVMPEQQSSSAGKAADKFSTVTEAAEVIIDAIGLVIRIID